MNTSTPPTDAAGTGGQPPPVYGHAHVSPDASGRTPHGPTDHQNQSTASRPLLDRLGDVMLSTRVARPSQGRVIGGVCAGIGHRFGIDPVLVRVGFVALSLLVGIGLSTYLALWLLLPDSSGRIALVQGLRERDGAALALLAFFLVDVGLTVTVVQSEASGFGPLGALLLVAVVAWVGVRDRSTSHPTATAAVPPPAQRDGTDLVFDPATASWRVADTPAANANRTGQTPTPTPTGGYQASVSAPQSTTRATRVRTGSFWGALALAVASYTVTYLALLWAGADQPVLVSWAVMTGALGLLLVGSALRGVRHIAAAIMTVAALVLAVPTAVTSHNTDWQQYWANDNTGEMVMRPATPAALDNVIDHGAGSLTLDLTSIHPERFADFDGRHTTVDLGVGDLTVVLPQGVNAEVRGDVGVGQISTRGLAEGLPTGTGAHREGLGPGDVIRVGTSEPDLVIDADLGIGNLTVEQR